MSAHTPGPWEVYMDRVVCNVAHHGMHGALQSEVCSLRNSTNPEANAKLIAAAPDLAEALGNALQLLIALGLANAPSAPQTLAEYPQVIAARAALAKAGL